VVITVGENQVLTLGKMNKIIVANSKVADVQNVTQESLCLVGKELGQTSILIWRGKAQIKVRVEVVADISAITDKVKELYPEEKNIHIKSLFDQIIVSGEASSTLVKNSVLLLLNHTYKNHVTNLLAVKNNPEIELDVKVIEIQKNFEQRWGSQLYGSNTTHSLGAMSHFGTGALGQLTILKGGITEIIDAQLSSNHAKILAQPNIISLDGKMASFLAGGKLFIPIPIATNLGVSSVSLQEENYGVSLQFTPNIISSKRVLLAINSEVSELAVSSTTYGTGNNLTTIPTIMTRKANTNIELNDGDSLVIAGLLQNNISQLLQAFPVLSTIPVLGLLFKSNDYQQNKTELIFIVTVHLINH
jgi:pilus assembly protein CpaC